jgi:integrase
VQDEGSRRALRALLVTGLRLNELLQLRWADVDEGRHRLAIRDSKTGPFTRIIGPELAGWFAEWRSTSSGVGRVFDITDLRAVFMQVERHGGKRTSAHDLRRTYLTFGERAGAPMTVLKRLANHSLRGDTTLGYVHANEADLHRWASVIEAAILNAARATSNVVALRA